MEPSQIKQIEALDKILDPNWTYIDIGASLGEMLQYFVQKMRDGYAFEPSVNNYNYLLGQFSDAPYLEIINKAVSDQDGEIKFWNNGSHMGNILGHDMNYASYGENYTIVKSMTLDSFLVDKNVDFIKIDIEGAEWKLFKGAKETLKKQNIIYQVEFHLDEDWYNRDILYDNGYEIYTLDFNKLNRADSRPYQSLLIHKNNDILSRMLSKSN